jgi:hypothetical protein
MFSQCTHLKAPKRNGLPEGFVAFGPVIAHSNKSHDRRALSASRVPSPEIPCLSPAVSETLGPATVTSPRCFKSISALCPGEKGVTVGWFFTPIVADHLSPAGLRQSIADVSSRRCSYHGNGYLISSQETSSFSPGTIGRRQKRASETNAHSHSTAHQPAPRRVGGLVRRTRSARGGHPCR